MGSRAFVTLLSHHQRITINRNLGLVTSSLRFNESTIKASEVGIAPKPATTSTNELKFDQATHTGQAWDREDYRMLRFETSPKQVNPNIAMHLIAEQEPILSENSVIWCDGGHPSLGHPRVYINLDKPGNHACGYCGQRFYNAHVKRDGSEHINC